MRGAVKASIRPVTRFVAAVLAIAGLLLLVDAGLTLAWQEPLSAVLAARQQTRLDRELRADQVLARGDDRRQRAAPTRVRVPPLARLARRRARTGHAVGAIRLPTLGRRYAFVQGTDTESLRKGPGHYPATSFPGQGGTVAIAGHRTTYLAPFRTINELRRNDPIILDMPYGRFTYRVERTRIVMPDAWWITRRVPGAERLVLSACHPLYSAARRIVVFARLSSAQGVERR